MALDAGGYLRSLFGLEGKRALVTGASSGLGAARRGRWRRPARTSSCRPRRGSHARRGGGDRRRGRGGGPARAGRRGGAGGPSARGGPVDILVNAAGIFERDTGEQTTQESWDRVLHLNTTVTFVLCQAIGRHMIERGGGKIVNFASTDGMVGVPSRPPTAPARARSCS